MNNRGEKGPFGIPITAIRWATTASAMALEVAVLVGLGYLADRRWGTSPWLLLLGAMAGLVVFGWRVYRLLREVSGTPSERHQGPKDL